MSDTALIKASRAGQLDKCIQLLKRNKTNDVSKRGKAKKTALMAAAEGGHFDIVNLLLEKGSSTDDRDKDGNTTLMLASIGGNVKIVELFLAKGADPNDTNKYGSKSITTAAYHGPLDIVQLLLCRGSDIPDIKSWYNTAAKYVFKIWPAFMGIIVFQELSIYFILDARTIIDFCQYIVH